MWLLACTLTQTERSKKTYKKCRQISHTQQEWFSFFAIDSNARSNSWHDVVTKKTGKELEEFNNKQVAVYRKRRKLLHYVPKCQGESKSDLTVLNNTAVDFLKDWAIYDRECCSDHNIIQYAQGNEAFRPIGNKTIQEI